jgi:hypothetical protein
MNAEREGLQSARQGPSFGPHVEPDPDIEQAVERRAAKSPLRRKRRGIQKSVEPGTPHTRYGAGF